ncbi:MAG: hypothetical protein HRT97_06900 [Moritella sp.]|uniref:hypothetical protein n=1 Tax=Moritella sp. TaxID=78556 RepID=UPI0025DF313C|nr:hypothetical protein [Moritella sp.]NQZ92056.1 hypothetical protein [Moritella sp.]
MATASQIRGAILEEAVLFLLEKVGYKIVRRPTDSIDSSDLKVNHSGLEVQGRGAWHQIDALAEQDQTPAFMFPLRLLVEAKCYPNSRVGIPIVRNSVGVHKDISENYFTKHRSTNAKSTIRFNYQSAIFSVSGYTKPAIDYAVAHQIFLIEYTGVPIIEPVIRAITNLEVESLTDLGVRDISGVRDKFKNILEHNHPNEYLSTHFTPQGVESIQQVSQRLENIGGSYFGMLQGRWPLHLLTQDELPAHAFRNDTVQCRLNGNREGNWTFTPIEYQQGELGWFELQFFLPIELAEKMSPQWGDQARVAQTKSENFSFIAMSGRIGGIWRNVKIELNQEWLSTYLRENRN